MSNLHSLTQLRISKKCKVTKYVDVNKYGGLTSCFLASYTLVRLTDRFCEQGLDGLFQILPSLGERLGGISSSRKFHFDFTFQPKSGWVETRSRRFVIVDDEVLIPSRTLKRLKFEPKFADFCLTAYLAYKQNWDSVVNRLDLHDPKIQTYYTCHGGVGGSDRASLIYSKDLDTNLLLVSLSDLSRRIDVMDEVKLLFDLIHNYGGQILR